MKEKAYPLEIRELQEFRRGRVGWFSRGHQDKRAFAAGLIVLGQGEISSHSIRHEWWRCVPVPGERFTLTMPARPGTRGAFPVTVVED